MKRLKKKLEKDFGKKCKEFNALCPVCLAWKAYELLASLYNAKSLLGHTDWRSGK